MKLRYKLGLPLVLVTVVLVVAISFFAVKPLKEALFREEFLKNYEAIQRYVALELTEKDFDAPFSAGSQEHFKRLLENLLNSTTVHIVIWDRNYTVLRSNLTGLSGLKFPNHEDLQRVFREEVPTYDHRMSQEGQRGGIPPPTVVSRFADINVPIRISGKVLGAVEIHQADEAILRPLNQTENLIFIIFAIGIVTLLLLIFVILYFIVLKPLDRLRAAAVIISGGILNSPIATKSQDEIGGLYRSFDDMRIKLKALYDHLDDEVSKRTREVKEEQTKLVSAINTLPRGLVILGTHDNILLANSALGSILGLTGNSASWTTADIEKKFQGVLDIKGQCAVCQKEKKPIFIKELAFGSKILEIFFSPIIMLKDHNEVIGNIILVGDITEAKVMERSREEFFAVASHELRTPLTAIRGNSDMILDLYADKIADTEVKEMLFDIKDASTRLIEIVSDFLDVSRLEQGRAEMKTESFNVSEVIVNVVRNLRGIVEKKGLKFVYEEGGPLPNVLANKARTEQVLVNLIGNAVKFTSQGSITVKVERMGGFLKIRVSDTGIGVSEQNQTLLFRKFQQAGEEMLARDVTRGTGLGLYISHLIVSNMGGTIGLEKSELGLGSTFAFTLPIAA